MIVFSLLILMARPTLFLAGDLAVNPGMLSSAIAALYYLKLDLRMGMVMALLLALGLGLFVVGWIIQFWGHYYEGRKPAFVDDLIGLLIGPLFVLAEAAFFLGMRKELQTSISQKAGSVR